MKKRMTSALLSMCLFETVFQSCSKDDQDNYQMDNQSFVTQASSSNSFEIAAGEMAVLKGQDDAIKHYGEHMVSDHSAVGNEMKALANGKGWTIPNSLTAKNQANLNLLMAATGAAFDKEFARIMVVSHQDAVNFFSAAASENGVFDADLRAFAAGKIPSLTTHLKDATTLNARFNP